jgi:hypothetical protein
MTLPTRRGVFAAGLAISASGAAAATAAGEGNSTPTGAAAGGPTSIASFGAPGGDAAFEAAARAGVDLFLPPGVYDVAGSHTFPSTVVFATGAVIRVGAGRQITFDGGIVAPLRKIFSGSGTFAFSPAKTPVGHPEWWGAVSNDDTAAAVSANNVAIQACVDAMQTTRLSSCDYHHSATFRITRSNTTIEGVGTTQDDPNGLCSRLVNHSATADSLLVTGDPASSRFVQHVSLRRFVAIRAVAPRADVQTGPLDGYQNSPCGIRSVMCSLYNYEDLVVIDHCHGFYYAGCVSGYTKLCRALRGKTGPISDNDFHHGFFQDNYTYSPAHGRNFWDSGNASVYFFQTAAFQVNGTNPHHGREWTAHYTYGGLTDTVVQRLECGFHDYGIQANGAGMTDTTYSAEDLHILDCVLDSCRIACIRLNACNPGAQVTIIGNYGAAVGAGDGIRFQDFLGTAVVMGNQLINGAGNTGAAIHGAGTPAGAVAGVQAEGNTLLNWAHPEQWSYAHNIKSANIINTGGPDPQPPIVAGIQLRSTTNFVLEPTMRSGGGQGAPTGVTIDGACRYGEVRLTGIDPASLAGRDKAKVYFDGRPLPASPNLAFGASMITQGVP